MRPPYVFIVPGGMFVDLDVDEDSISLDLYVQRDGRLGGLMLTGDVGPNLYRVP
jgi:hypothetical protein